MGYDAPSVVIALSGARAPAPGPVAPAPALQRPDAGPRDVGPTVGRRSPAPRTWLGSGMSASPDNAPDPVEAAAALDLAARIRAGDAGAEHALVERYSRGLTFILRRATCDPSSAEDLLQETLRIVIERLRGVGLEQPERLAGFIRRTARNLAMADNRRAARRRASPVETQVGLSDPSPTPLSRVLQGERVRLVRRLVGELRTDRDRQILYRYYLAEEDKDNICKDLGLSDVHFNRVLFRARQRFRELLERGAAAAAEAGETAAGAGTVLE